MRITKKAISKISAPSNLSPEAKKQFVRLYDDLTKANIATSLDIDAICLYCETLAEYQRLTQFLNKNGYVIEQIGDKKQILTKLRPEAQLRQQLSLLLLKLQSTLCINPASRAKYANLNTAASDEEESEMLEIIGEYPEPIKMKDTRRAKA